MWTSTRKALALATAASNSATPARTKTLRPTTAALGLQARHVLDGLADFLSAGGRGVIVRQGGLGIHLIPGFSLLLLEINRHFHVGGRKPKRVERQQVLVNLLFGKTN